MFRPIKMGEEPILDARRKSKTGVNLYCHRPNRPGSRCHDRRRRICSSVRRSEERTLLKCFEQDGSKLPLIGCCENGHEENPIRRGMYKIRLRTMI